MVPVLKIKNVTKATFVLSKYLLDYFLVDVDVETRLDYKPLNEIIVSIKRSDSCHNYIESFNQRSVITPIPAILDFSTHVKTLWVILISFHLHT